MQQKTFIEQVKTEVAGIKKAISKKSIEECCFHKEEKRK